MNLFYRIDLLKKTCLRHWTHVSSYWNLEFSWKKNNKLSSIGNVIGSYAAGSPLRLGLCWETWRPLCAQSVWDYMDGWVASLWRPILVNFIHGLLLEFLMASQRCSSHFSLQSIRSWILQGPQLVRFYPAKSVQDNLVVNLSRGFEISNHR